MDNKINQLEKIFPECITEKRGNDGNLVKAVNFELLKEILTGEVSDAPEAYDFTWVGKKSARIEAYRRIDKTLRPCVAESVNFDTTQNLYIEGDNLDVLKLLQQSYFRKVKMIYIDPPYNTGNDFIYRDNFKMDAAAYNAEIDMFDDDDNRNFKENADSNPRFHSDWCSMIYSRLLLARNLLTEDGVIFISIDDNEQANLKKICDEVFGTSNFIANVIVQSNSSKNNANYISVTHEYLLIYAKDIYRTPKNWCVKKNNIEELKKRCLRMIKDGLSSNEIHNELLALTKYPRFFELDHYTYSDERGPFRASDLTAPGSKNFYDIIHPIKKIPCKTGTRGWAYSQSEMKKLIADEKILFGEDETVIPRMKNYLFEDDTTLPKSVVFFDSQSSTKWMKANNFGFSFPKALDFIKFVISMYPDKDAIVLDFFSGSATTAHAVIALNAEDGGNRKFIMVQLPENCAENSEAYKAGYKNICEIGKERIRRAGIKIKNDAPLTTQNLDIGFRVLKVDSTNFRDVSVNPLTFRQEMLWDLLENIKADRNDLDLLYGCLISWGVEFNLAYSAEKFEGATIHNYGEDLVACFEKNISLEVVKHMAKKKPRRAIFCDSCFARDDTKINASEIFKLYAPNAKFKVI